jgi:YggT family protein
MAIIQLLYAIVTYAVAGVIIATIVLMLLRLLLNYMDVNPFTWFAMTVRRFSDPFLDPIRRSMMSLGFQPNLAPLVVILIAILLGWFAVTLAHSVLLITAGGVYMSLQQQRLIAVVGYLIYGALSIYELLIFIRIIFSWGRVSYANRLMRFLVRATDPLLVPLRRIIPPLGMMDISPIVAFILIWLFKQAVAGTLLQM